MSCPFTGPELGSSILFCYKAEKESDVSFSSVWAFGPEFRSPSINSRFRAGVRQTIIYVYQMHWFYWFGIAIYILPLQRETSQLLGCWISGNLSEAVAVHTMELFQILSLSPAYSGCVWTWYMMRSFVLPICVWTEVTWRCWGPHGAGAVCVPNRSHE